MYNFKAADTPFLVIGQRISVYDIFGYLDKKSERQFEKTIIPAVLENGTSIDEDRLPLQELRIKEKAEPYVFLNRNTCKIHQSQNGEYSVRKTLRKSILLIRQLAMKI
ncbi:MAG: hypothetical protein ACR5K6_01930 [Wolbachia sp.]